MKLTPSDCELERCHSIRDTDRDEWEALARDIYASHGWLRIIEETFLVPVEHRYFLVRSGGTLVGAAMCHLHEPAEDVFTLDDSVFGRFKRLAAPLGLSILPSLICGPLRGYGQHFIFRDGLDRNDRQVVATVLLDALEQEATDRGVSISFNNVMDAEGELARLLKSRGFARTVNFPLNFLDITWDDPAEYHKLLSKRKLVREINRNRREGVVISQLNDVEPRQARLHQLLDENYLKYNYKPLPVRDDFVSLCKRYLGPEAVVYVAEKAGQTVGTIIMFHRDSIAYVTDVGVDHEATGNDFTYFNLSYYHPISEAVGMGIKRIHYGTMMYTMKAHRGCTTTDIYLYHRPRHRLLRRLTVPLFAAHGLFKAWFIRRNYM